MTRPRKNNAEWFSHDTSLRDNLKIKAIRSKYGLEGYAIFVMILEVLADADNFVLEIDDCQIELLAGDFRIEGMKLKAILEYLQQIGLLQNEQGKIFSTHLIERMDPLMSKRQNMRQKYQEKKEPASETPVSASEIPPADPIDLPALPKKPKIELMSEEDFETFWKEYPIKEDKKKAKEKFVKLQKSLLPKILQSITENRNKNDKWLKGFIKLPTTWINGECWNNEIQSLIPNNAKNGQNQGISSKGNQGKVSTEGHADLEV